MIPEQIALAAVFYFGQVFTFCRLINKNALEWFLLIIWYTLNRSTNLFRRNHPTLCFWLRREDWQMSNTKKLFYQLKNAAAKNLQYSWENTCKKFLRTLILKNICIQLLLNWLYEVIVWNSVSESHLKWCQLNIITKILVAFKPEL